jgi:acylpyruvate hydrolase
VRFASLTVDGRPVAAAIEDGRAIPLTGIAELGRATPASLLADPPLDRDGAIALDDPAVRLRPVVPAPDKVICVGLNYREHVAESLRDEPDYPVLFTKWAATLAGPYDDVAVPPESAKVDYEGELVVIVGERVRRAATRAEALGAVGGYAVANDVSMRDFQHKSHQWLQGKAWDASTPVGPHLVTPDEVGDPSALRLRTSVNGEVVQDATTDLMIFDVATLVMAISAFAALEPGDLILTGTPGGVGVRRDPPLLLGDGDVVAVAVDGVGRIESTMKEERP